MTKDSKLDEIVKVTAAILEKGRKILIAKRNTGDKLAGKWEFPGGKIEDYESPEECLRREMHEEFKIKVSIGEFVGSNVHHYDHISIELLAYRSFWEHGDISLNDHAEYRFVPLSQLGEFDFAPADIPFVERLIRGDIDL